MNAIAATEPDEDDRASAPDDAQAMLMEGIEEALTRIADVLEEKRKAESGKPMAPPVVNVAAPAVHVAAPEVTVHSAGKFEFTFHRDSDGRLTGCTAVAK